MKRWGYWLAICTVLGSLGVTHAGEKYLGEYQMLRLWHTTKSSTPTYYDGQWGQMSWLGTRGNTGDHWYQITWDTPVNLTGVRVMDWQQFSGGTTFVYKVQYSLDGTTGWTDVPTPTVFAGSATGGGDGPEFNVTFTSTVVGARALRAFFPAGNYVQGGSGNGPGVSKFLPRGYVPGGIDVTDPQFNILATVGGFQGLNASVTLLTNNVPLYRESPPSILLDQNFYRDGPRTGWYNGQLSWTETIRLDLGKPMIVRGVRVYSGTHYIYLPSTSFDVYVSNDPVNWGPMVGAAAYSGGYIRRENMSAVGRYVILTHPQPSTQYYILMQEISVSAFEAQGSMLLLR